MQGLRSAALSILTVFLLGMVLVASAPAEIQRSHLLGNGTLGFMEGIADGLKPETAKEVLASRSGLVHERPALGDGMEWMYKVVMAEAAGEPYEGQVAVANVLLNRLASGKFGNTILEVIFQPYQFSPTVDGRIYRVEPNDSVKRAVSEALNGKEEVPTGTYYFVNVETAQDKTIQSNYQVVRKIGNHTFFR